jgi:phage terminase large subunit-like protein
VMNWNVGSAVLDTDPAGNRKPTKEKSNGRIDGVVAAVMASGVSLREVKPPDYKIFFV